MKITKRQLRRIIREVAYDRFAAGNPEGRLTGREPHIDPTTGLWFDGQELQDRWVQNTPAINVEKIEDGPWDGARGTFVWADVTTVGPGHVQFDWRSRYERNRYGHSRKPKSMYYRLNDGEVEGQIPKQLLPYLKKLGLKVVT